MLDNILFYFVFLSQIILISFYYPKQITRRIKYVLETYPPSEYPKLYPKNIAYYDIGQRIFRVINQVIFVLGFIILFLIGLWDNSSDGKISEVIPLVYFFIQMAPLILIELSEFAYFKLMRKANVRTTRKAELLPRRLFDFISPKVVALAVLMNIACIAFFYSLHQFQFDLSNDTFVIAITLTASNIIFAGIIFWNLYGKKLNPHQATKDRIRQIEITVKSLVYMSIAASVFLIISEGVDELNLDYLEPSIMSLYLQFIILIGLGSLLRNLRIENIDFEVYKNDVSAT